MSVAPFAADKSHGQTNDTGPVQIQTTVQDYFQKGTQPLGAGVPGTFVELLPPTNCTVCHASYGSSDPFLASEPYVPWVASMMGQSGRDPLFYAGLTIANQDAANAGEYCIRCHVPQGFLAGHSLPPDGSALDANDRHGVHCNFCHRMVNPVFTPGVSPAQDEPILNELAAAGLLTPQGNNSRYTIDPTDVRRGPFNDIPINLHSGDPQPAIIASPFHTKAEFCWTCHDVSNPLMSKQAGEYVLNAIDGPHPTGLQEEMFPLHRTYAEWKNSYYSTIGVQHNGRFGGNHLTNPAFIANRTAGIMKDCQDCHMPDQVGYGCNFTSPPFLERQDAPQHSFIGSNTWVVSAIRLVDADGNSEPDYPDAETGLTNESVDAALTRTLDFLSKASDMDLTQVDQSVRVRIHNKTGHKLPTGFPDGRRIWINVQYFDCNEQLIFEHGAYDFGTATLDHSNTKVYEAHLGIQGAEYAASIGRPEGPTFHFVLANVILKDNRIPPAGYSTVIAQQNQTAPVGAAYANGQSWDDTVYDIPPAAKKAVVTAYYQLASKEFMEYLRDDNTTDNRGQVAYDLWVQLGMSPPVPLDSSELILFQPPDVNRDGQVNIDDLLAVISAWGACQTPPFPCPADVTGDGNVNIDDLLAVINAWGSC